MRVQNETHAALFTIVEDVHGVNRFLKYLKGAESVISNEKVR